MIIIGLVVLIAAVIVGVVGVMDHTGSAHALTDEFSVFGYHVTGSTGMLFLYGIAVGAIGMFGLSVLLTGARRNARQARHARRELKQTRREAAAPVGETAQPIRTERNWRHPFGGSTGGPTVAPR
ncbi:MAG TPA: hypothetical protein VK083_02715 [Nocardia sp.]|uniref:hypothetical protein n=1 Tax=Nocardia TaxID=1817 RepID=UPI002457F09C|nr:MULTISPECIES: hypothetical protein [Nocardia]HLS75689.1 hypothetical protein [Nocardia sp.]